MLQTIMPFVVAILIGYLLGCFNLAFIISKVKFVYASFYIISTY